MTSIQAQPSPLSQRERRVRAALVVSAIVGPVALFFLVRIPLGCSVLNLLGLP